MENSSAVSYRASSNFIHRTVAGNDVLISVGGNIANFNGYIQLNETAAFLWQQLSSPKTEEELCAALIGEFEVSAEQAAADVKEFLGELVEEKMVSADG
ncbi:MAG: PqqD family protein [Eubacteriales bacterium]|nr:PqqD family protein [Eubacteriales bacterium]